MWNWTPEGSGSAAPVLNQTNGQYNGHIQNGSGSQTLISRPRAVVHPSNVYQSQPAYGQQFYYGYQGNTLPGAHPGIQLGSQYAQIHQQPTPQFTLKPRKTVEDTREKSKSAKRKTKKKPKQAPILKRKEKRESSTSISAPSSFFAANSSTSSLPRSSVHSTDGSQFGGPDLPQESVQSRASILVINDHRSLGKQSLGSRSAKSRASAQEFREYRPAHIPDPPVPGYSRSDESGSNSDNSSESADDLSQRGIGYTRSIETTSIRNSEQIDLLDDEEPDFGRSSFKPPTPPPVPQIPLYAVVNKNRAPKPQPATEDPIYSTIDEARKEEQQDTKNTSKPTNVLDELKLRLSIRSKAKVLAAAEQQGSDLPETSQSQEESYHSAFRPYNPKAVNMPFGFSKSSKSGYDKTIPIDKVVLKDGSEPSDLQSLSKDDQPQKDSGIGSSSNIETSSEIPASLAYVDPIEPAMYRTEPQLSAVVEGNESKSQTSHDTTAMSEHSAPVMTSPPVQGSQLSAPSQVQGSDLSSAVKHEPKPHDNGFVPKSILKKFNNQESSSEEEETDYSSDSDVEENEDVGDTYHPTIPVEESTQFDGTDQVPMIVLERQATPSASPRVTPKGTPKSTPKGTPQGTPKQTPSQTPIGSLREARKRSLSASENFEGKGDSMSGSARRRMAVKFTQDTRDNEGTAKHYEKEPVSLASVYTAQVPPKAVIAPEDDDNQEDDNKEVGPESTFIPLAPIPPPAPPLPVFSTLPFSPKPEAEVSLVAPAGAPVLTSEFDSGSREPQVTKPAGTGTDPPIALIIPQQAVEVGPASQRRRVVPDDIRVTKEQSTITEPEMDEEQQSQLSKLEKQEAIEPAKVEDYALVMKSPKGILKHPNGTATLQLHQANQFVISPAGNKTASLPRGSLTINTNLNGSLRSNPAFGTPAFRFTPSPSPTNTFRFSPKVNMSPMNTTSTSPTYTLRQTGDNISVVSIAGYDPIWDSKSAYSNDTIRTLDDYATGTIRTMVSLGSYTNPYVGNEGMSVEAYPYGRQLSESSTDPLAFTMSYDSKLFDQRQQQPTHVILQPTPQPKVEGVIKMQKKYKRHSSKPKPDKQRKPPAISKSDSNNNHSSKKTTTFADHELGQDSLYRQERKRKRKKRLIKIGVFILVCALVIITVSLLIYFLTDSDNKQDSSED